MRVISLGWGCQSWALAAMSALGVLPRVDAAIHADTTHERAETYEFARRWTLWLEERGVRVVTVKPDEKRASPIYSVNKDSAFLPCFTTKQPYYATGYYDIDEEIDESYWVEFDKPKLMPGGNEGQLRRQCTSEWKILPIRRWLRSNYPKEQFEMWLGITLDEVTRMKQADVKYITNAFPFVEMLDRPWTRGMVMKWLIENDLEVPVKSSCVFCPYHDKATWREIKLSSNGDWQKALEVDEAIRDKRPGYKCYLIADRIPLADADFRNEEDHGQLSLWGEECEGMCFL